MKKTLAALAALSLTTLSVSAQAQDAQVKFDDLNLATAKGQKMLDRRIDRAARSICGIDRQQTGTRMRDKGAAECYAEAKAKASAQVAALIERSAKGG